MSDQQRVSTLNHLTKVEVNKATVDEVVGFGLFMKKSDVEVTEAIDLYKALGDDIPYGPEDQSTEPLQQD